ncbi:hypothetical protein HY450_00955 [Candidatus Pacearchaeota archaeon]|nr:hypothetical protein [Candidatus Pacearchaeota archaeon]
MTEQKTLSRPSSVEPQHIEAVSGVINTRLAHYLARDSSYEKGGLAIVWDADSERGNPLNEHLKLHEEHQIALEYEEAISELERISKQTKLLITPIQTIQPIGMQLYTYSTNGTNNLLVKQVVEKMIEEHS